MLDHQPLSRALAVVALATSSVVWAGEPADSAAAVPSTAKRSVTDTYLGGLQVTDDYRWLERDDDPEVARWTEQQNRHARAVLDILPSVAAIRARVTELATGQSVDYRELDRGGPTLFALKLQPPKNQPLLVTLRSAQDLASERVVLDPNVVDSSGHTAIDWFFPSLDGARVAVSLSQNGSESGTVHVYDSATGKELGDEVPRAHGGTAGGSLAWNAAGDGFFYTRYPAPGERPPTDLDFYQQIYFHKLGTPASADTYSLGKEFPRIAEIQLEAAHDGRRVLAQVANGDGGEFAFYLSDGRGGWVRVADFADRVVQAHFGRDDALYLLSLKGAPRGRILRLPLAKPILAEAKVIVPEGEGVIERVTPTETRLYVTVLVGGPNELITYDLTGKKLGTVALAPVSSVDGVVGLDADDVLVRTQSYIEPPQWIAYRAKANEVARTALVTRYPADLSGLSVTRELATSKDGTKVPLTIVQNSPSCKRRASSPTATCRRCSGRTAATASARSRASPARRTSSSSRAGSTSWPISGAAASSARPGTVPAT
jgi:prolyl oligopeptidase